MSQKSGPTIKVYLTSTFWAYSKNIRDVFIVYFVYLPHPHVTTLSNQNFPTNKDALREGDFFIKKILDL